MRCSRCETQNDEGGKFCRECGSRLAQPCPSCASVNDPRSRFCSECGARLRSPASESPLETSAGEKAPPTVELRRVSVLFADLAGFTTLSERRDPEEVRELLTRFSDTCSPLIARHGGTVEKYIGDAVMAVWGTPSAHEDDAERAVRTALDLVDAVTALGQEMGTPELRARVGVKTGEAAVTIGATGQGMVAGDLVNTASRIQGAAPPGSVYVGDAAKRATEAAIVYEDAGLHTLKGKAQPVRLWRALRVIGLRKGALRSSRLEAPFVGRDGDFRLIKELFHASSEEGRTRLVSVIGHAGMGKSRLSWELRKYTAGLASPVLWHLGRCLSYGEGVTYWALAEMVRRRASIADGEDPVTALPKLQEMLEAWFPDEDERRWVEPRLAHLAGLEERTARDPQDLFGAWGRFFERMAEHRPTLMVFEDLQWAEAALLDFIRYLMDGSRNHALFILTLARPEIIERYPEWGAGKSGFTQLYLEPLSRNAMEQLLSGLVPGLPKQVRSTILERAEGVPLYAMETVRMLLDRGLLIQEESAYRPAEPIDALEAPDSLQVLIAERLDGLALEERQLLRDASVLGRAFTVAALSALSGVAEADLRPILTSLVRKEILWTTQMDPRSPTRGQYTFLQELVREVAYARVSKSDRKERHLAAALYLSRQPGEDETVEEVASHYLQAYRVAPQASDAAEIKAQAVQMLIRAGHRAASLAASEEAQRYFDQAAGLADDSLAKAEILERAGEMAWRGGRASEAEVRFDRAISLFEAGGRTHSAARLSAHLVEVEWQTGRLQEGIVRMEHAFQVLRQDRPDEDLAQVAAQLGRLYFHKGEMDLAAERIETALSIAGTLEAAEVLSQALVTKGLILNARGRPEEALGLMKHALEVAMRSDLPSVALRANRTLAYLSDARDRYEEALAYGQQALELARQLGDHLQEWRMLSEMTSPLCSMGRWDEALHQAAKIPEEESSGPPFCVVAGSAVEIHVARGEIERAEGVLTLADRCAVSADVEERFSHLIGRTRILRAAGKEAEALSSAEQVLRARGTLGMNPLGKAAFVEAMEAALALGDGAKARHLLGIVETLSPGERSPFLEAQRARFQARLTGANGEQEESAGAGYETAVGMFRELETPFWRAVALLEHVEWLSAGEGRADGEAMVTEAKDIFQKLRARPFLERLQRAAASGDG